MFENKKKKFVNCQLVVLTKSVSFWIVYSLFFGFQLIKIQFCLGLKEGK